MLRKISFDPAWIMLLAVIATLVILNFMNDEHARNVLAAMVLAGCFLLFITSVIIHSFANKIS